jgi:hypothetical protein
MNELTTSPNILGLFFLLAMGLTGLANAADPDFEAALSGAQEVVFDGGNFVPGGRDTPATGTIRARFDKGFTKLTVNLKIDNLVGTFAAAHFHCARPGQNGPIAFGLQNPGPLAFNGRRIRGDLTNTDFTGVDCLPVVGRPVNNLAALALAMRDGLIYINVHSSLFPIGEIRGQLLEASND